jgi:ferredoxin/flavodoxin---NADP+ reductase
MNTDFVNGTDERPVRVAIVGSGPGGFYALQSLFDRNPWRATCDMFDRLPTPYGLVRGGVAPDHANIKAVIKVYEKLGRDSRFRFFGNVMLGRDIQVADLRTHYDAIVYAVGNESDTKMGVPGEDLPGCHSATDFVGWYNCHPDFLKKSFRLDVENVVVVGMGNVAMDVVRILARDPEELAPTDIAPYALDALREVRRLKRIYVLGRRGPVQAAFSPKEIKEIGDLGYSDLIVSPDEVAFDATPAERAAWDKDTQQNVEYVVAKAKESPGGTGKPRQVILRFLISPVEFIAGPDGAVATVKVEKNKLRYDDKGQARAAGTGEFFMLPAELVMKAVGYRGVPVPGVPFDERKGVIPNVDGRVVADMQSQQPVPGEYAVGWAKRGPTGLIGTNKPDSVATVDAIASDFSGKARPPRTAPQPAPETIPELLRSRGVRYVTFEDWKRIDAEEVARGKVTGKVREKFLHLDDFLGLVKQPT